VEEPVRENKRNKKKGVNGAQLAFPLKDHEIYDDLGVLRRVSPVYVGCFAQ
jgi:hypothetical protein